MMNITNVQMLIGKIKEASYYFLYRQVYGEMTDNSTAFINLADAIASF